MKNIILLGATGSIGTQTLDLIKNKALKIVYEKLELLLWIIEEPIYHLIRPSSRQGYTG